MTFSITAFPKSLRNANTPYQTLLYGEIERQGVTVRDYNRLGGDRGLSDVLHIHWPDRVNGGFGRFHPSIGFWQARRLLATAEAYAARGRPIVWTVHNVDPHDFRSPKLAAAYAAFEERFLNLVTATIHLSESARRRAEAMKRSIAGKPSAVIAHMTMAANAAERRPPEGFPTEPTEGRRFAALGQIRRYKKLDHAVRLFTAQAIPGDTLVIAGTATDKDYVAELSALVADRTDIIFLPRGLSDGEFAWLLDWADILFALNAGSGNSGVLMSALSAGKPVVTLAGDLSAELNGKIAPGWVIELGPEDGLPVGLLAAPRQPLDLSWASLATVAAEHVRFFERLRSGAAPVALAAE